MRKVSFLLTILFVSCSTVSVWDADPRESFICSVAEKQGIKAEDIKYSLLAVNEANISLMHLYEPKDACDVANKALSIIEIASVNPTWGVFIDFISQHVGNDRILKISSIILLDAPKNQWILPKDIDILVDFFTDMQKIYCEG